MKNQLLLFVLGLILVVSGCNKNVPMSGTVTFSDDGSPVPVGTVCFETDSFYARGELDQNGHYVLGFAKAGEGLPAGEYSVCVTGAKVPDGVTEVQSATEEGTPGSLAVYKELVDAKFHSGKTSGLTCKVDSSTKTFDFQVDRAK